MSINRIAKFSNLPSDSGGPNESRLRGFVVNPFGPSIPDWQIQIYLAAFEQAQRETQGEQDPWDDFCI
jgi:hypothetical protein